mgnify:CR=1 FL=1
MEKAKYCYCKNTYSLDCGDETNCNEDRRELWAQGIGDISAKTTTEEENIGRPVNVEEDNNNSGGK